MIVSPSSGFTESRLCFRVAQATLPFLKPARDALARTLPHSRRVEFPGLDHGASSDPSTTNPGGKPGIVDQVAREVRSFFATLSTPQETK